MKKLLLCLCLFVRLSAQDNSGYLMDLICEKDTTKDYYTVDAGDYSGWRVIQIIKPYVAIAYWNRDEWYDCYPCLVLMKDSFWKDGTWRSMHKLDYVPEINMQWIGIREITIDGFNSRLPVVKRYESAVIHND